MSTKLKRRPGLTPAQWTAWCNAADMANISLTQHPKLRVTQAIGNAKASAGFHARDGWVTVDGHKEPYCAATDGSVLWLTLAEIKAWLNALAWWGFAGWYRPWTTNGTPNYHIHVIYAGLPKKPELVVQLLDFVNDRNGLKGHGRETFYTGNKEQDAYILRLHKWAQLGGPHPGQPPKAPRPAPAPTITLQAPYTVRFPDHTTIEHVPALDGRAWVPVREWYAHLGITTTKEGWQRVKWHPVTVGVPTGGYGNTDGEVYIDGTRLAAPVRLLDIAGERRGYAPVRELAAHSGLRPWLHESTRIIEIIRPKPNGGATQGGGH